MADPQPNDATTIEDKPPAPASAEDRKAAAALSSLDAHGDDDALGGEGKGVKKSEADQKALGEAMSRLEILDKGKSEAQTAKGKAAKESEEKKKKVKVDAGDVALLVEELELSKLKATELLKSHDGDLGKALTAYITASA